MTELLRNWLFGLAGAAIVCSLATALTPEGRWRKITGLVCGVVMVIALISPLKDFNVSDYGSQLSEYRNAADKAAGRSEEISESLNRTYIQEECEAYILDKAADLNAGVRTEVTARWDTGGWWYPYEVKIVGDCGEAVKNKLTAVIEADLGIPAERQYWSGTDE